MTMRGKMGTMSAVCLLASLGLVAGCANGARQEVVDQAEASVEEVQSDPGVRDYASVDLDRTEEALARLRDASQDGAELDEVEHLGYLVERRAEITEKRGAERVAWAGIDRLGEEREAILLDAQRAAAVQAEGRVAAAERDAQVALLEAQEARDREEAIFRR
jgi:hypothetical protein